MSDRDVQLGQQVRVAGDPSKRWGRVVGVVFLPPSRALVRWGAAPATFEELSTLVEAGTELAGAA
jgi:hypothetical protein